MRYSFPVLCLILSFRSFGFGYFDSVNKGTSLAGQSPVAIALGSARAIGIGEPSSIFTNPALATGLPLSFQTSFSMISYTERVINSDLDQDIRSLLTFDNITGAAVWPIGRVVLGAGYAKVAEFGYEGTHNVFDNPEEPMLGVEILYSDGGQWETMGSISLLVAGSLSAGISGGLRSANADYQYDFNSNNIAIPDSSSAWSIEADEFAWHAGLSLDGQLFKSGLSYSSKTEYMDDVIAVGGSAYAAHLNNITVGFEGEVISPFDVNHFIGKLSVIMPLTKNLNALTSASFDDQRIADRAGFGFGLGFIGQINRLSLSGGVYNRFRARVDTSFPNENADRVDDSLTQLSFGVTYLFSD